MTDNAIVMKPEAGFTIPAQIKRNTLYLAVVQAAIAMATQLTPTLGAIMVIRLLGSAALAGVGIAITWGSRFFVAYVTGWIMDRYGRRAGLMLGIVLTAIGAVGIGLSMAWLSFPLFLFGMLVFGLGAGAGYQTRLAAADMYPQNRRAEGVGWVLMGSLVGAFGGPPLLGASNALSPTLNLDPLAIVWLAVPLVLLPTVFLVFLVRPDPKEIAANLAHYYPGLPPVPATTTAASAQATVSAFLHEYPKLTAFVASFAIQGNMAMMMTVAPLVLQHHGHGLEMISLAVVFHFIGMYGLSVPLGGLTDRFGRRPVMLVGMAIGASGSLLVPFSSEYWAIATGGALVGLGWSCVNVAASVLIADTTPPLERGRAIGLNDTFSAAAMIITPLAAGAITELAGMAALGIVAASLVVVPTIMLVRLVEYSPGRYRGSTSAD